MNALTLCDETNLSELAAGINAAHREAQAYAAKAVERALQAGDLLLTVKARLAHGEFGPWCTQHLPDISERTIRNYMRVARELPRENGIDADLTLNAALRLVHVKPLPVTGTLEGWYDNEADTVWSHHHTALAFRDAINLPDIRERLTPDQILPLAVAVHQELETINRIETPQSVASAVKRRFKEAYAKTAEEKYQEQKRMEPHLKMVRALTDGAFALRKAKQYLHEVKTLNQDYPASSIPILASQFFSDLDNLIEAIGRFQGKQVKDITPHLPMLPAIEGCAP